MTTCADNVHTAIHTTRASIPRCFPTIPRSCTMAADPARQDAASDTGTAGEVFITFLRLGLTSFGGPIAHVAYFRTALVVQRRWVSEAVFAELLSLTQFLPG